MKLSLKVFSLTILFLISVTITSSGQIAINEFMSDNTNSIVDQDGEFSDWIELYNYSNAPINLLNYSLSDQDNDLTKWKFPEVIIPAHSFLVIFASNKDILNANELHTNFKISSSGEPLFLSNNVGQIIDQIDPVELLENQSYGRSPDGSDNLLVLIISTPKSSNNLNNELSFEFYGGFYKEPFYQKINSLTGDTIYYTLDGSIPTENSNIFLDSLKFDYKYDTPNVISDIPTTPDQSLISYKAWEAPNYKIDKASILRCATYRNGTKTSEIFTHTYIVDSTIFDKYEMPIVSLITDADNFFDHENGIYTPGAKYDIDDPAWTGNYFERGDLWERPVHVEYFEQDGTLGFSQNAGMRIHGGKTRQGAQKSFKLYARDEYGKKYFDYSLMPHRQHDKYKRFLLQTTFGSWENAIISDVLSHEIVREIGIDFLDYRPVVVFINGEYWGIQTIRDKIDERYVAYSNNLDEDSVEIRGFYNVPYLYLKVFVESNDLSIPENYEYVKSKLDIENFIDYYIAEMFLKNFDWPANNIDAWIEKNDDGKWKWLFYDIDAGFGNYNYNMFDHLRVTDSSVIWPNSPGSTSMYRNLMENEEFKNQFINRYAELLNSTFQKGSLIQKLNKIIELYEPEIPRHIARWNYFENISDWKDTIDNRIITFIENRPCVVEKNLKEFFNISTFDFHCVIDNNENPSTRLLLAPNPNTGNFFIYNYLAEDLIGEIVITDILGRVVFSKTNISLLKMEKTYFDFSHFPNNTYILNFKNKNFTETKKFILLN
ncbi:MAG: CotH kinase family protein [Saprospiraceae bacterium]